MPTVSTIIPTSIGGFTHIAGLMPLLSQESDNEIIVVDNNSKDGTLGYLGNYDCIVKINRMNLGFAKANNQGAKIAQGEFVLLLNNDTSITPGFIGEMVKTFDIDPKIAVVGCAIYTMENPKRIQHAGVMFTEDYIPYELGLPIPGIAPGILKNDPRVLSIREVPSVTAACMMVRKSVYLELGGLNENYFCGWEDSDFVLRVREAGYKVWYNGKASILHKHFGSPGRFKHEQENRSLYDSIWVHSGRAEKVLGKFKHG